VTGWLSDATIAHLRAVSDEPDLSDTKYRLLNALGRGGMASVYAAEDTELGREVALKVIAAADPDGALAARMLREARILARLEHPGIVPVHDVGSLPDGRIFYVMKRVRGRRLDELLPELLERAARLRIFERICEAVACAHAHGVLHRDLKPENIMVGEFGEVLVMDWGVAKVLRDSAEESVGAPAAALHGGAAVTQHGTRIGTPGYMAPEQVRGDVQAVGTQTDVWGLGAILHVLLQGGPPGEMRQSSQEHVPRRLRAILDRALAPDPTLRYADADALAEDVRRFRAGATPNAYHEPLYERIGRLAWKYRTPIALILSYVLMRILLLAFTGR
jgi:serine/threonine protein kinase